MTSPLLPCPVCGFFMFSDSYGSYELCTVCDWEDDALQLANPLSGGANEPLADCQEQLLRRIPLEVRELNEHRRSPHWRPLTVEERDEFAANVKYGQPYKFSPVFDEVGAYWMKSR